MRRLATVVAVAAATLASATAAHAARLPTPITVRVGGPAAVAPTSTTQGFLGIATELNDIPRLAGPASDPDAPFATLVRALSPGAPPLVRLGGNSGDDSWWPIPGIDQPYLYDLTPAWAAGVQTFLQSIGGTALIGVTLKLPVSINARVTRTEVQELDDHVGANLIDAFELGNEPEFYPASVAPRRAGHYTFADYGRKFRAVASGLGGVPLAGPATGSPRWLPHLGTVLADMHTHVKLATIHAYPLKNCSLEGHLRPKDFFAPASIAGLAAEVHTAVREAAARGEPLRVDEMNGITCGGQRGFSNTFAEALWALNVLPALWRAGVVGVNFQSILGGPIQDNLNDVFSATHHASGWRVRVEPVYDGLLAFARAVPAGSRLLRVSGADPAGVYRWAVRAPDGSLRIVLTNVGARTREIDTGVSGRGVASVSILHAASLSATGGARLGEGRISARTGELVGTPVSGFVAPHPRGVYRLRVAPHSAGILTIPA